MIRVIRDASGLIFIDGREDPIAGGLQATQNGSQIAISNTQGGKAIVCGDFSQLADADGNGFASVADAMAYLATVFDRPTRLYQDVLTISTQNVIPPLTFPWKSAPGCFANIIVGSATFANGGNVVSFTEGSTIVSFEPYAAGFNLNPTETVIAQYSYQG